MAIQYPQFPRLANIGATALDQFDKGMEQGRESLGIDAFGRYLDMGQPQAMPQMQAAPSPTAAMSLSALGNQAMGAPVAPVERQPLGPIGSPSAGTQPRLPDPATARVQQAHGGPAPQAQKQPRARIGDQNQVFQSFMGTVRQGGVNNPYALAAIASTGKRESGFSPQNATRTWSDPSESGAPGQAGGIMSWRGPRYDALVRFGGGDLSPETQARFFLQENPQLVAALNSASSVEEAQRLMDNAWRFAGYNRPGGEAAARLQTAQAYLGEFGGGGAPNAAVGAVNAMAQGGAPQASPQAALESMAVGQQMPAGGQQAPAQRQQMAQMGNGGFPMPQGRQPVQLPPREVMMDLFKSPATRPIAIQLAQAAQSGQQIEQYQTFQREDGSIWQMNTQTGQMEILQKSPTADGGAEYGLTPQYGVDAQGNPVIIQLAKDGTSVQTPLPDGVSLSREPIRLDAGTHHVLLDPITRQQIGMVPKENRQAAYETGFGGAEGKAAAERVAGLPQAEQNAQEILSVLDTLENHPGLSSAVGWQGNLPEMVVAPGGSQAAGFMSVLNQVGGQAFLQAFESLKGGGQITEIEGQKGTQAITRLNRNLSEAEFKQAIQEFREVINAGLERARRGVRVDQNGQETQATTAPANAAQPAISAGPVQIVSEEDYINLPSGAEFVAPDGSVRRKP